MCCMQVAKRYKKEHVKTAVYYNDLLVQMDAKALGEAYNKTDPPKQVGVVTHTSLRVPLPPPSSSHDCVTACVCGGGAL